MVAKWAHPVLCTGDFILEDLGRFKCGHMAKEGAKASARLIIYYPVGMLGRCDTADPFEHAPHQKASPMPM
jgi:hypothetical protein